MITDEEQEGLSQAEFTERWLRGENSYLRDQVATLEEDLNFQLDRPTKPSEEPAGDPESMTREFLRANPHWKMVNWITLDDEPTEAMIRAGGDVICFDTNRLSGDLAVAVYHAMRAKRSENS